MAGPAAVAAVGGLIINLLDKVKDIFPSYEEETVVSVHGNALSTKADLFRQAIAIAFGQNRRINFQKGVNNVIAPTLSGLISFLPPFYLQADYDMMGKSVTVTLRYLYNGAFSQPLGFTSGSFQDRFFKELPSENLCTDSPNSLWFAFIDKEQFKPNRMIASGDYGLTSQPGFPGNPIPGEGSDQVGVRGGSFLEQLVFAALAEPCQNTSAWLVPDHGQLETSPIHPALDGYDGSPLVCQPIAEPNTSISTLLRQAAESALRNASGIGIGALIGGAVFDAFNNPGSLTNILQNSLNAATGGLSNLVIDLFD